MPSTQKAGRPRLSPPPLPAMLVRACTPAGVAACISRTACACPCLNREPTGLWDDQGDSITKGLCAAQQTPTLRLVGSPRGRCCQIHLNTASPLKGEPSQQTPTQTPMYTYTPLPVPSWPQAQHHLTHTHKITPPTHTSSRKHTCASYVHAPSLVPPHPWPCPRPLIVRRQPLLLGGAREGAQRPLVLSVRLVHGAQLDLVQLELETGAALRGGAGRGGEEQ